MKIEKRLTFHGHFIEKIAKINALINYILSCTLNRVSGLILNNYRLHVRPLIDYASHVLNVGYVNDLRMLQRIQRRWTRAVLGIEHWSYDYKLKILDLISIRGRRMRCDLISVYKIINGPYTIPRSIFSFQTARTVIGHALKLYPPEVDLVQDSGSSLLGW